MLRAGFPTNFANPGRSSRCDKQCRWTALLYQVLTGQLDHHKSP
jgi:hypothetical protein